MPERRLQRTREAYREDWRDAVSFRESDMAFGNAGDIVPGDIVVVRGKGDPVRWLQTIGGPGTMDALVEWRSELDRELFNANCNKGDQVDGR